MSSDHDKRRRKPGRVSEPVQVYLERPDSERLERLTAQLDATKSDVLRRGLAALEREVLDPENDPILKLIGIAGDAPLGKDPGYDVAVEHDRFLADSEIASWGRPERPRPKKKARRGK